MNWPTDFTTPEQRLYPSIYEMKERLIQIDLLKRWIPIHLQPIFDELVKEKK